MSRALLFSMTAVGLFACMSSSKDLDSGDSEETGAATDSGDSEETGEEPIFELEDPLLFSPPTVILETPGNAKLPSIVGLSDGSVHVVWHDFSRDPATLYHGVFDGEQWTTSPLELHVDRMNRPALIAEGNTLHMLFDVWTSNAYTAHYASYSEGTWSEAQAIGLGSKGGIALDGEDGVHVVIYHDNDLAHYRQVAGEWVLGDPIPTPSSVNPFGLSTVSTEEGLLLAVGAGACGSLTCHDITVFNWNSQGWSKEVLYKSNALSSDEPNGALQPDGSPVWVWVEQVPYEPYITGIAFHSNLDPDPLMVFEDSSGFATEPSVAIPPDGVAMATWSAPGGPVMVDRYPFEETTVLFEVAKGPAIAVDAHGFTHVVVYAVDETGNEQIWHTSNREQ